jgi:hypothetical protein
MRRTSHALVVEGGVWLIDPVDAPALEGRVSALGEPAGVLQLLDRHERGCAAWAQRLGVSHLRAWESVGPAPFEVLRVRSRRWWHEVALWEPTARTLVCADALGTVSYFRAHGERIGLHPLMRAFPPQALARVAPARIICGQGRLPGDGQAVPGPPRNGTLSPVYATVSATGAVAGVSLATRRRRLV